MYHMNETEALTTVPKKKKEMNLNYKASHSVLLKWLYAGGGRRSLHLFGQQPSWRRWKKPLDQSPRSVPAEKKHFILFVSRVINTFTKFIKCLPCLFQCGF